MRKEREKEEFSHPTRGERKEGRKKKQIPKVSIFFSPCSPGQIIPPPFVLTRTLIWERRVRRKEFHEKCSTIFGAVLYLITGNIVQYY